MGKKKFWRTCYNQTIQFHQHHIVFIFISQNITKRMKSLFKYSLQVQSGCRVRDDMEASSEWNNGLQSQAQAQLLSQLL